MSFFLFIFLAYFEKPLPVSSCPCVPERKLGVAVGQGAGCPRLSGMGPRCRWSPTVGGVPGVGGVTRVGSPTHLHYEDALKTWS